MPHIQHQGEQHSPRCPTASHLSRYQAESESRERVVSRSRSVTASSTMAATLHPAGQQQTCHVSDTSDSLGAWPGVRFAHMHTDSDPGLLAWLLAVPLAVCQAHQAHTKPVSKLHFTISSMHWVPRTCAPPSTRTCRGCSCTSAHMWACRHSGSCKHSGTCSSTWHQLCVSRHSPQQEVWCDACCCKVHQCVQHQW